MRTTDEKEDRPSDAALAMDVRIAAATLENRINMAEAAGLTVWVTQITEAFHLIGEGQGTRRTAEIDVVVQRSL